MCAVGPPEQFRLDGKAAIVTGAPSGLGVTFAKAPAAAGADLAIGARRSHRLEKTRVETEALGRRCVAVPTDVTSPAQRAAPWPPPAVSLLTCACC